MRSNAIVSLAILKVNYDENKDYLDTFLPMVAECIRVDNSDIIGITDIQEKMKELFCLDIPQHAIKALLNKAKKAGYLIKDNKVFKRDMIALNKLNFSNVRNEMLKKQNELITDLIKYVNDKFEVSWEPNQAEEYLLKFIEINQIMSFKKKIILDNDNMNITNKEKLYIAKYIEDLIKHDSHLFEYLEEVLKGLIISTVVFFNEPAEIKKNFKDMTIYFDTSFIIFALGYADENKKIQCDELLKLVYENNIKAKCFRHTIDEVTGILTACAHKIQSRDISQVYGPSMEYFIKNEKTKSDIMLMISTLEKDLSNINIKIEEAPKYNNKCYIDEEGLKEALNKNITYNNIQAIDRDIKSISAITILRNGKKTIKIEDCGAIFVTTNLRLVREVNKYLNINEELTGIMPIISDYAITNLLWLKKPLGSKDLSRKRMIAECFAATQPNEVLWNKYIAEVDRLKEIGNIGEEESYYFKYAPVIKEICMDVTHGDEETICEGTALEVIKRAREVIAIEESKKFSESFNLIEEENKKVKEEINNKNKAINRMAYKKADKYKKLVKLAIIIGSGAILFLGQNLISNIIEDKYPKVSLYINIFTFILALVGFVFSIKGESIDTICEKARERKYNNIIKEIQDSELEIAVDINENL